MTNGDRKASILIVDDRPESLLAIEVALEELGEGIIKASSGEEALRHLLRQEFAVILLDVNMPGLDGFETAALIRGRRNSDHIPIIFITAFADDMLVARGYSLGAVDYILAPVVPQVLRTKVGVFVDLYRKNQQVSRQAEWLGQRAARLHRLTGASLAIHSAMSIDRLLEVVTDIARDIVGCRHASTLSITEPRGGVRRLFESSDDGPRHAGRPSAAAELSQFTELVLQGNRAIRMSRAEIKAHLGGRAPDDKAREDLPTTSWLAVPLRGRDGRNMGLIQLADRADGDFTDEDEAVLVQLAQMASIAIENTLFAEEREANRVKDEFLATLSHELRTPLNAILGWTQILQVRAKGQPELGEGLSVIERNVRAQNRLIEDLLDVSRIARGELRVNARQVELGPIVRAAIDAARPATAGKKIEVALGGGPLDVAIFADPDRLQQVFGNLLSNAVKFTAQGGRIDVSVVTKGLNVEISVSDNGAGIEPEFLPFVFERFRQADSSHTRRFTGLGIGLTIVRHIVELHGGTVHAASPGKGLGTTISVTLPLVTATPAIAKAPEDASAAPAALGNVDLSGSRVLVVDDEPDARDVLAEGLRRCGAEVTCAGSAAEAVELFHRSPPDLIVSDLAMPNESGYSLIRRIRALPAPSGTIPAIALSALAAPADRSEALASGFQVHVAKPCDPHNLTSLASKLIAARSRDSNSNPVAAHAK